LIDIVIEDAAWTAALPDAEALARRTVEAIFAFSSPLRGGVRGGGANSDSPSIHPHSQPSPRKGERALEPGLAVLLTSDLAVQALNARFRGQDKPTNVLAFPAPANVERFLGDVALGFETCAREAAEQGKPLGRHLQHLTAHGVLHLLGYDHMTDAEACEMEGLERAILAGLGVPDPYQGAEGDDGRD